jgi:hypothetical protein
LRQHRSPPAKTQITTISKRREVETAITVLSCLSSNVSAYKDRPILRADIKSQEREEDTEDRLRLSLDALAKICLSSAQGQVIAATVAITQDPVRRIELFVSASPTTTLHPSLVNYIESIWVSLNQISNSNFRQPAPLEHSPPLDTSAINDLGVKVYENCSVKFFRILKKRFGEFQRFSAFIHERNGALPLFFADIERYLDILHQLFNHPLPPVWTELVPALRDEYLRIREVIEQERWLDLELVRYKIRIRGEYYMHTF